MNILEPRRRGTLVEAGRLFLVASLCLLLGSCRQVPNRVQAQPRANSEQSGAAAKSYGPPQIVGALKNNAIDESSGLVASRSMPGKYWTHNDSGDGPFIYAIDEQGEFFGVWRVTGAQAIDWEDISIGPGPDAGRKYLYIGDIGDNDSIRTEVVVYRVAEPGPTETPSSKSKPHATEAADVIRLRYPDGKHDAEALLVDPTSGAIYIATKVAFGRASVYVAAEPFVAGEPNSLKKVRELRIPSPFGGIITGGSVSPDGKRIALCDYFQGYEMILPTASSDFGDIWTQPIVSFNFGKRERGESIAYRLDGRALLGTSEGKGARIFAVAIRTRHGQ